MEFSRQEYWSGLPFPFPGNLPDPGIEPTSLMSPALAGGFFTTEPPGKLMSLLIRTLIPSWRPALSRPPLNLITSKYHHIEGYGFFVRTVGRWGCHTLVHRRAYTRCRQRRVLEWQCMFRQHQSQPFSRPRCLPDRDEVNVITAESSYV